MGNIEDGKFTIYGDRGERKIYDVLFTFVNQKNGKNYICYTDHMFDMQGEKKLYASTYNPDTENMDLKDIKDKADWEIITNILAKLYQQVNENEKKDSDLQHLSIDEYQDITEDIIQRLADESDWDKVLGFGENLDNDEIIWLYRLGMTAYENKNFPVAEKAYLKIINVNDDKMCKNNLAYMIRRKEVQDSSKYSVKYIVSLLREGVKSKDAYSVINMALLWVSDKVDGADWRLVDKLIHIIEGKEMCFSAASWWEEVARNNEAEGYLVHLLLIRHGKIETSRLGTIDFLFSKAKEQYVDIPERMRQIVVPFF